MFSRGGTLLPSISADARYIDDVIVSQGLYTAPTDEALAFDIQVVPMFGMNMIRLHQKVNPERWYVLAEELRAKSVQSLASVSASPALCPLSFSRWWPACCVR